jgi:hypothetical protein
MRVHREIAAGREQQHVVVVGAEERLDRHQAVAAGTVLDHDRLAPARRQPLRQQPRADIGARAGTKRHDELDCPLRPFLRQRRHRHHRANGDKADSHQEQAEFRHAHLRLPYYFFARLGALRAEHNALPRRQ